MFSAFTVKVADNFKIKKYCLPAHFLVHGAPVFVHGF